MAKKETEKSFFPTLISNPIARTIVLMIVLLGILIALFLFGLNVYTKHGESVAVPDIKGLQVAEAAEILKKSSLGYEVVESVYLTDGVPGAIIDQIPEEGSNVKKDRIIFLRIQSETVEMVTIPALKDFSQRQAVATLNSLGFKNVTINEVASAYRGLVLDVSSQGKSVAPNSKLAKGSPVTLTVGAGGQVVIDSLIDIYPEIDNGDIYLEDSPSVDNSYFD